MKYIIFANLMLWGGIAFAVLPDAIKADDANQQAVVINHKFDNLDNQSDLDDEIVYQASDKAKTIKAANESLRRIKQQ